MSSLRRSTTFILQVTRSRSLGRSPKSLWSTRRSCKVSFASITFLCLLLRYWMKYRQLHSLFQNGENKVYYLRIKQINDHFNPSHIRMHLVCKFSRLSGVEDDGILFAAQNSLQLSDQFHSLLIISTTETSYGITLRIIRCLFSSLHTLVTTLLKP